MVDQRIEPPNPAELGWIEQYLDLARGLHGVHTGNENAGLPSPAALDEMFAAWLDEPEPHDPNPYINAIGLAFGQALVDGLELTWAVVTDSGGTEIAVHGQPGDILVFPTNLVAKRFETRTTMFIAPLYDEFERLVAEARNASK